MYARCLSPCMCMGMSVQLPLLLMKVNKSLPATYPREIATEELPHKEGNRVDTERKRVGKSFEKV